MDILVNVANQKLKIATNLKSLVAGTQEFVKFTFNLTGDWDNLMTFAQFQQNGVAYNVYLDENNSAYLPSEIGVGTCTLMLYGSNDKTIATTNYLTLTIDENIIISDANSTEISESLYTQLVTRVNTFLEGSYDIEDINAFLEESLAKKEAIDNKISDKRFITNSETNYPSIAFLEGYYYNIDEIAELLDEKDISTNIESALAEKANKTDVEESLAEKETIDNKISDITKIVDNQTNYPSIAFLENYYYNANNVNNLLDETNASIAEKADKTEVEILSSDKADRTDVENALAQKVEQSDFESALAELAEKEAIDNKITDKTFITNSETNYPSIAFLENYFYNIDEADVLLDKKANSVDVGTALATKANANDVYEIKSVSNILKISQYSNTINGITVTVDANNHLTISGTASKYTLIQDIPVNCILETGANYTLSTQNSAKLGTNDKSVSLALGGHTSSSALTINYEGQDTSKTFTAETDNIEFLWLQVASGATANVECDIQLEKGEEYTEFVFPNTKDDYILKLSLQDGSVSKEKLNEEVQNKINVIEEHQNKIEELQSKTNLSPKMNYLYVSLDYQEDEEGFGETKFNSILDANNSIIDNSEFNRYTIIVKAGTYNEFEETYSGSTDTEKLQGIETKNYVYYESENINNPSECVLSWDGSVGYEEGTLTDTMAIQKCIFHIKGGGYLEEGMHTHIKGFTITSKNTRYGLHIESGGYGRNVNWLVENCIIEYGGRPFIADSKLQPVLGMGMSPFECGKIRKCVIKYSDDTTWNPNTDTPKAIVCHNNSDTTIYTNKPPVIAGAELNIKDCKFNDNTVTFSTKPNTVLSDTKFTVHLDNNVGISSVDNSEAWLLTDGISPETTNASITHTWDGTILTITTDSGTSSADLKGEQGIQGEKGETGADGKDGIDGVNGTSVTVTNVSESTVDGGSNIVTFSDGKTVTIKNGTKGSTGDKGADGYTPVKGTDYFTEEDKAEIVDTINGLCIAKQQGIANVGKILVVGTDGNLVLADMSESGAGGDVIGTVDESNNILLTGNLADGTYSIKYEMEDGSTVDIGALVLDNSEETLQPTNLFVVGGDGYIESGRCSSTGADRTDTATCFVTNYIDVAYGDIVYIKNYTTPTASSAYSGIKYTDGTTGGFMLETDTTIIKDFSLANGIAQFTINAENADYVRLTILKPSSLDDIIITVNEPLS